VSDDRNAASIHHYLGVFRRRWFLVLAVVLVTATGAVVFSLLQTPRYAATAEILVPQDEQFSGSVIEGGNVVRGADAKRSLENQVKLIESDATSVPAEAVLGFPAMIQAQAQPDADILTVRAESDNAEEAALIANTFAETYVEQRTLDEVRGYEETQQVVAASVAAVEADLAALQAQLAAAADGVTPDGRSTGDVEAEIARLEAQRNQLRNTLSDLELRTNLTGADRPQVINPASVPASPFEPTLRKNLALALILGAMIGVGLAFLVDFLDESIKSKDELEEATDGLTVLAAVPKAPGWKAKDGPVLHSLAEPESPTAEGYRSLRTSLQYLNLVEPIRSVLVTSSQPDEGKSTTVANLAVTFASANMRVVVVSCDLRRPRVHQFLGVPNDVGLTSVLRGELPLAEALRKVPGARNVVVLPSGPPPPNPSELLSTAATADVMQELGRVADLVILDAPPVLPVSDAQVLARYVDASLLVARTGVSGRRNVRRAVEALEQVDARLVGSVLVGVPSSGRYNYQSYSSDPVADEVQPGPIGTTTSTS
jgi:capsular exopolysaccharide synthesis family protein